MNALDGYMLIMKSGSSITGAGALYVGDAATTGNYIARSAAAAAGSPCVPTVTIKLAGAGLISTTTQRYYGWIPTTPSAHPAWSTIAGQSSTVASAASGQAVVNVAAGDGVKFVANQTVTISDANNTETNTVSTIATDAITMTNNLAHTYTTATITTTRTTATGIGVLMSSNSNSGQAVVAVPNGAAFIKGQAVTIGDSVAQENNIISSITGNNLTMGTNLANSYTTAHYGYVTATNYPGGQKVLYLTDDMGLQVGDLVAIGLGGTPNALLSNENTTINYPVSGATSRGVYIVSAYDATHKKLTLTVNLGTGRIIGDFIAKYNRPISLYKAVYNSTPNNIASGVMQGVHFCGMRGSGNGQNCNGCTMENGGNSLAAICMAQCCGNLFTDCVTVYGNGSGLTYNDANNMFVGCAAINSTLTYQGITDLFVNCVTENYSGGMGGTFTSSSRFVNCSGRAGNGGLLNSPVEGGQDNIFINCSSALALSVGPGGGGAGNADILYPRNKTVLYNCTLSSPVLAAAYSSDCRMAPWNSVKSFDLNGVVGAKHCWCRGGHGITGAYSTPYNAYANPMKFVIEAQNTPTSSGVLIWDIEFEMPANKSLIVSVPMARDTTNIAAELWIVSSEYPPNDPLWFDPAWQLTPTQSNACTTMGSATTTYVVGRSALTAAIGTWQTVTVPIPPYFRSRHLTARIIGANNTAAVGNFYADIETLEKVLMKKKVTFL
jgi:hypothetical protein